MTPRAKALSGLSVQCIRAPSKNQPEKRPVNLAAYGVFGGPWGWFQRHRGGRSQATWVNVKGGRQRMRAG